MFDILTKPAFCTSCLAERGLCRRCAETDRFILPQLAVNVGWLRMMGEVLVEQKKRQSQRTGKPTTRPKPVRCSKAQQRRAKKNRVRNTMNRLERAVNGQHLRNQKVA